MVDSGSCTVRRYIRVFASHCLDRRFGWPQQKRVATPLRCICRSTRMTASMLASPPPGKPFAIPFVRRLETQAPKGRSSLSPDARHQPDPGSPSPTHGSPLQCPSPLPAKPSPWLPWVEQQNCEATVTDGQEAAHKDVGKDWIGIPTTKQTQSISTVASSSPSYVELLSWVVVTLKGASTSGRRAKSRKLHGQPSRDSRRFPRHARLSRVDGPLASAPVEHGTRGPRRRQGHRCFTSRQRVGSELVVALISPARRVGHAAPVPEAVLGYLFRLSPACPSRTGVAG